MDDGGNGEDRWRIALHAAETVSNEQFDRVSRYAAVMIAACSRSIVFAEGKQLNSFRSSFFFSSFDMTIRQ